MDYRFVVQVMLRMFHACARISFISLFLTYSLKYKPASYMTKRCLNFHQFAFVLIRRTETNLLKTGSSIRMVQRIFYYHFHRAWHLWIWPIQRFMMLDSHHHNVQKVFIKFYNHKISAVYCIRSIKILFASLFHIFTYSNN